MKSIFKLMLGAVVFAGAVSCSKDSSNEPINDGKIDPSTIASSNLVAYFPMENAEATVTPAGQSMEVLSTEVLHSHPDVVVKRTKDHQLFLIWSST